MAGERWIFTKSQLVNTPSRQNGVDSDKELSYRQQAASLIQDMGKKLQVTQLCINTAIVYMQRFYMFQSFTKFHRHVFGACFLLAVCPGNAVPQYYIGAGIGDMTGPAGDVNMMGYANPAQNTHGIHFRIYSRAYIIADAMNKTRVVFVSIDTGMMSQGVKLEVMKKLQAKYGNLYTVRNLCISGTHSHSGPGGFHTYLLYDLTALGFVRQTFDAMVNGIFKSVQNAHESLQPGDIEMAVGEVDESNINRSPTSYLRNPESERKQYKYNVDKNMTLLKLVDAKGKGIGMINWFAVHGTSMNNTNHMISGDNKGYASYLFENQMNNNARPGFGPFVAAFASTNLGDVSPNTKGPHCLDTGKPCDVLHSTCNNRSELCVASGPGKDMFQSTQIIGDNQYKKAKELYDQASVKISGPVDFKHSYIDMTNVQVQVNATTQIKTCKTAMGYSFAAGTTDGPGAFNFEQGSNSTNLFWNLIRDFLAKPSKEQVACHHPKPILLDTGEISRPYLWQPDIVDVQMFRIGQLVIIAIPAEFTTMSGRRIRKVISATLIGGGFPADTTTVIAGLSNDYADYVATFEEYQAQRYEAASTIYGPHTLEAFIQEFNVLAEALVKNVTVAPGPNPPDLLPKQLSFLPPVIYDEPPIGKDFGEVLSDAPTQVEVGAEVSVVFVAGDPRNDLRTDGTFLTVDILDGSSWTTVERDSDWNTRFKWKRVSEILGTSESTIQWFIPKNQKLGTYRICHYGNSKRIFETVHPYSGCSRDFQVVAAKPKMPKFLKMMKTKTQNDLA